MGKHLKKIEDGENTWFQSTWRPAMAWQYLVVCLFDFLAAPIMNALYSTWADRPFVPWDPLTIRGGGLYHIAMAAVVGVTAWTRGSEKLKMMELDSFPRRHWYAEDRGEAETGGSPNSGPAPTAEEPTEESERK